MGQVGEWIGDRDGGWNGTLTSWVYHKIAIPIEEEGSPKLLQFGGLDDFPVCSCITPSNRLFGNDRWAPEALFTIVIRVP